MFSFMSMCEWNFFVNLPEKKQIKMRERDRERERENQGKNSI